MDLEALRWFSSLGVGGCLAGLMFLMYRKDMKENAAAWRGQSDMLMVVVKENTAAITALITLVEKLER